MNKDKLIARASLEADIYVQYALGKFPAPEEQFSAKEDYMAGYLHAAKDLDWVLAQMKQILDLSSTNKEFYSHAIAKYTLQRIKHG